MSVARTVAPSEANNSAVARPDPLPRCGTTAVLPARRLFVMSRDLLCPASSSSGRRSVPLVAGTGASECKGPRSLGRTRSHWECSCCIGLVSAQSAERCGDLGMNARHLRMGQRKLKGRRRQGYPVALAMCLKVLNPINDGPAARFHSHNAALRCAEYLSPRCRSYKVRRQTIEVPELLHAGSNTSSAFCSRRV